VKKVPKKSRKVKRIPMVGKGGMPGQVGIGNEQTALAALFAALDVSNDERPAENYFPPYGMEQYQNQYDMAPQYSRDAAPAYAAGYGHGPYLAQGLAQPWANAGAPLIY
jgi:hypothetical protein